MEKQFDYNQLPVRTLTDENEETWFAGIDIFTILEYQNPVDVIKDRKSTRLNSSHR